MYRRKISLIPSCLEDERKRILDICTATNLPIKVIPFLGNLLFDDAHTTLLNQVRDIKVEVLLGREPIKFDNADIRSFINNKVCMVTGGGGLIGSELVRQIAKYDPKRIIIVDICENYAYEIQQDLIMEYGDTLDLVVRIASVRDYYRMNQLFSIYKPQIVFHKEVPFFIVESYKSIRTNVTFSLSTFDRKIFAVSSSNPGEGKSTTSANIAIAMAQSGSKVLLIDADMRKSVQHKIFGIKNKKGLSSAVSKISSLEDCIQKNVMENLDVMTAGPIPPNPSELLASEQMTAILNELSEKYTVIIIDTPPVNVVTDAMELAKNISGIIMVVRYAV